MFFFKRTGEDLQMTVSVTPRVLSALQELEDKSRQTTVQDFGTLCCLVRTPALMSYDVGLEGRTCSCWRWQVTSIPCSHALAVLRDRELQRETYCNTYFNSENFRLTYSEVSFPITDANQSVESVTKIVVKSSKQRRQVNRPRERRIRVKVKASD